MTDSPETTGRPWWPLPVGIVVGVAVPYLLIPNVPGIATLLVWTGLFSDQWQVFFPLIGLLTAGYIGTIAVLASRPRSRRFGVGMLIGLVATLIYLAS